jgi:DNA repair protein SbcD/Mre11
MRFLHLADIHLDTRFACRSEAVRVRLREALREAFRNAVDLSLAERLDAVLIAGDLFDSDRLHFTTERFLMEQLRRLEEGGVPVFYASGNHDPSGPRARSATLAWPENVHRFAARKPEAVDVLREGEIVGRVVGAGHPTDREAENLAGTFPRVADRMPHVALLHAHVASAGSLEGHDRYAPCSVEDFAGKGYGYWALGHIHARQHVCAASHAWFAGNIQGRSPRETGPKGGLLVSLDGRSAPAVTFHPFAPVQWAALEVDGLEQVSNYDQLRAHIAVRFAEIGDGASCEWMLRLTLTGPCPMAGRLETFEHLTELGEELVGDLGVLDVEVRTRALAPPADLAALRAETTVLAEVLRMLEDAAVDDAALEAIAPEALASDVEPANRPAYLRDLLEGLDREAALHLLRDD